MNREEALKVLEMFLYKQCDLGRTKFTYDQNIVWDAVHMAAEALEYVEKRKDILDLVNAFAELGFDTNKIIWSAQEWIPCSERLPSESDYYLVTNINAFGEKEVCVIWFAHKDDYYGESEWREITDDDIVLAWMPLPKPYKAESEEV